MFSKTKPMNQGYDFSILRTLSFGRDRSGTRHSRGTKRTRSSYLQGCALPKSRYDSDAAKLTGEKMQQALLRSSEAGPFVPNPLTSASLVVVADGTADRGLGEPRPARRYINRRNPFAKGLSEEGEGKYCVPGTAHNCKRLVSSRDDALFLVETNSSPYCTAVESIANTRVNQSGCEELSSTYARQIAQCGERQKVRDFLTNMPCVSLDSYAFQQRLASAKLPAWKRSCGSMLTMTCPEGESADKHTYTSSLVGGRQRARPVSAPVCITKLNDAPNISFGDGMSPHWHHLNTDSGLADHWDVPLKDCLPTGVMRQFTKAFLPSELTQYNFIRNPIVPYTMNGGSFGAYGCVFPCHPASSRLIDMHLRQRDIIEVLARSGSEATFPECTAFHYSEAVDHATPLDNNIGNSLRIIGTAQSYEPLGITPDGPPTRITTWPIKGHLEASSRYDVYPDDRILGLLPARMARTLCPSEVSTAVHRLPTFAVNESRSRGPKHKVGGHHFTSRLLQTGARNPVNLSHRTSKRVFTTPETSDISDRFPIYRKLF